MNVIVMNQQEDVLASLGNNIEVIKTLRGTFSTDYLINTFSNFYFVRMIIDVTALENYEDVVTYQQLSIGLPIDKIILLIPSSASIANNYFLSKLISMGYYNFTTNAEGILYLMNKPNTYKDVAAIHQIEQPRVNNMNATSSDGTPVVSGIRILGIKNVTDAAGSSTLTYMIKKYLEEKHNFSVLALEVDKRDFAFFREKNMLSTDKSSVATELLKARNYNYVLVDLNDYEENICDETIYLIEPSVVKLNKLMARDRTIFEKLKGKKVIINKSVLNDADIKEFATEANISIFYVLPPINDRESSQEVADLLLKLGMIEGKS